MRVAVCAVALLALCACAAPPECIKEQHPCVRNSECCAGCCHDAKCVPYADACAAGQNPCALHECRADQECYLQQVQCLAPPCDPLPACRSVDYTDEYADG